MRATLSIGMLLGLIACAPEVPDSAAGVGFDTAESYAAQREEQLAGRTAIATGARISDEDITTDSVVSVLGQDATSGSTTAPRPDLNNPGISDEQDFSAVASRESIESDRQRISAQRQAYKVIEPTALPTRSGSAGPSIVDYALSATNRVGQSVYKRSGASSQNRFDKNCAKFASSDQAQIAFLKAGGPERDRNGVDPDGDGFACYWDPTPFRQAVRR